MSPCENCHAGCCRSFAIPLSGADIIRLENGLDLTFWDFACRWADPHGIIAQKYAPHLYFEDEPETPFVIALMHTESEYFPGTTRCRFLAEGAPDAGNPRGRSHCGVYEHRPAACGVFPTRFNDSSELAVIHDVPERSRGDDEPVYELCPRQWEPEDLDPVQPLHDLLIARYEMQFFSRIAELWNRRCGAWEAFPDFLRLVYSQRVTRQPAALAKEQPAASSTQAPSPLASRSTPGERTPSERTQSERTQSEPAPTEWTQTKRTQRDGELPETGESGRGGSGNHEEPRREDIGSADGPPIVRFPGGATTDDPGRRDAA